MVHPSTSFRQRGQAVPLLAAVTGHRCRMLVGLGHLGPGAADAARARTAADAAALAGAAAGRAAAVVMAGANGGPLVAYTDADGTVRVTVPVGAATAVARAAMVRGERRWNRAAGPVT